MGHQELQNLSDKFPCLGVMDLVVREEADGLGCIGAPGSAGAEVEENLANDFVPTGEARPATPFQDVEVRIHGRESRDAMPDSAHSERRQAFVAVIRQLSRQLGRNAVPGRHQDRMKSPPEEVLQSSATALQIVQHAARRTFAPALDGRLTRRSVIAMRDAVLHDYMARARDDFANEGVRGLAGNHSEAQRHLELVRKIEELDE